MRHAQPGLVERVRLGLQQNVRHVSLQKAECTGISASIVTLLAELRFADNLADSPLLRL